MTEVGSLRVSLGLNSIDFTQGMKDINRKITALGSEFKTLTAGAGKFDNSLESLRAKSDVLTRTFQTQGVKVDQLKLKYEESARVKGEEDAATEKLLIAYNRAVAAMRTTENQMNQMNQRIEDQTDGFSQLKTSVVQSVDGISQKIKVLNSSFSAATAGIRNFGSTEDELQQKSHHLTQTYQLQEQQVRELTNLHQASVQAVGADAQETRQLEIQLNNATAAMRTTQSQLQQTNQQIQQQGNAFNQLQNAVDSSVDSINRQIKVLNSSFNAATAGIQNFGSTEADLQQKAQHLNQTYQLQQEQVNQLTNLHRASVQAAGADAEQTQQLAIQLNNATAAMRATEGQITQTNNQIQEQGNAFNQLQEEVNSSVESINRQIRVLNSSFNAATAGIDDFGSETEQLQQTSTHLNQVIQLQQQRVAELTRLHNESAQANGHDAEATQELAIQLNNATAELRETEHQLSQTTNQIEEQSNSWHQLHNHLTAAGNNMQEVGGRMQSAGSDMAQSFGAAFLVVGGGLAVTAKKAMDFEQQMSSVKSVMSPDEVNEFGGSLEKLAITMGAKTKYSAIEAAQGIEELIKAGVSVSDIMNGGLQGALSLATAGELELGDAAEIASTALNAFKSDHISVIRAADLLAGAANASATSVGELKFSMSAVSAVASGVGISFKDTISTLAAFAQNGLKGSDAGTSLKTMLLRLSPTTKSAREAFDALGLSAYNVGAGYKFLVEKGITPADRSVKGIQDGLAKLSKQEAGAAATKGDLNKAYAANLKASGLMSSAFYDEQGNVKSMSEIAGLLQNAMKGLNDEQRQNYLNTMFGSDAIRAGNILYKEGAQGLEEMGAAMEKIKSADVAAEKLDNVKGRIEQLKGSLETAAISLGTALLPAIDTVTSGINKMTNWFNNLSPKMQSTIAIGGLVTVAVLGIGTAFAAVIAVLGGAIAAIGTIVELLGAALIPVLAVAAGIGVLVAEGVALYANWEKIMKLSPILRGVILAISPAMTVVVGAIKGIQYAMSDSIPKAQLFGEGISKATQKAVGSFVTLNTKAGESVRLLSFSGQTVTKQMAQGIIANFDQMGSQILAGMKKKNDEQISTLQGFFSRSAALTQAEEKNIIAKSQAQQNEKAKQIEAGERRIAEILNNAAKEKRSITSSEGIEIQGIRQGFLTAGIQALSKNELESKSILERMKAQAGNITARQAADVVKNSKKQTDEAIKEANRQYDKVVQSIIQQRDEAHSISADQAAKLIADAKLQKDQTVAHAKDMQAKVVSAAKKQAGDHAKQVDWETGTILSKWDVFRKDVGTKAESIKNSAIKSFSNLYNSAKDKFESVKKSASTEFENMKSAVSTKAQSMKTAAVNKFEEMKKAVGDSVEKAKSTVSNKFQDIVNTVGNKASEFKGKIQTGWNNAISYLKGINLNEIGSNIMQGLINGISSKATAIADKVKSIAHSVTSTIKSALDIHSPSRVTHKLGEETGQGFANGIAAKKKAAEKAAKEAASRATKAFNTQMDKAEYKFKMGKISANGYVKALKNIRDDYAKTGAQIREVNLEIKKTEDKHAKELAAQRKKQFDTEFKAIKDNAQLKKITASQELKQLQNLADNYKAKSQERIAIEKEEQKVRAQIAKEKEEKLKNQFENEKAFIDKKKNYNQLSLTAELKLYEQYVTKYKKGSEQREYYELQIYNIKKQIYTDLKKLNDDYTQKVQETNAKLHDDEAKAEQDYSNKIKEIKDNLNRDLLSAQTDYETQVKSINDRLIADEQSLTTAYEKSVDDRTKALYSFSGLFDEINRKDVSGQALIDNLNNQVNAFQDYQTNMSDLASKGVSQGLLDELQEAGPRSVDEIKALNSLSADQLQQYVLLWQQKSSLARQQATKEQEGLRIDTQIQIQQLRASANFELDLLRSDYVGKVAQLRTEAQTQMNQAKTEWVASVAQLRKDANAQLAQYKTEWMAQVKEITSGTTEEFNVMNKSMKDIGQNTIKGLMDGMKDMEAPLKKQAQAMADAISKTIKSALQIKSPSRVMKDLGKWVPAGLAEGIKGNLSTVIGATKQMASAAIPTIGKAPIEYAQPATSNNAISTASAGTNINQHITINSPKYVSPSETARLNRRELQKMAFSLRG